MQKYNSGIYLCFILVTFISSYISLPASYVHWLLCALTLTETSAFTKIFLFLIPFYACCSVSLLRLWLKRSGLSLLSPCYPLKLTVSAWCMLTPSRDEAVLHTNWLYFCISRDLAERQKDAAQIWEALSWQLKACLACHHFLSIRKHEEMWYGEYLPMYDKP